MGGRRGAAPHPRRACPPRPRGGGWGGGGRRGVQAPARAEPVGCRAWVVADDVFSLPAFPSYARRAPCVVGPRGTARSCNRQRAAVDETREQLAPDAAVPGGCPRSCRPPVPSASLDQSWVMVVQRAEGMRGSRGQTRAGVPRECRLVALSTYQRRWHSRSPAAGHSKCVAAVQQGKRGATPHGPVLPSGGF